MNKVVEGNSYFSCRSLAARMINGDSVSICATGDVAVDAVYSADASIHTAANIDLKLLSGTLQVNIHVYEACDCPLNAFLSSGPQHRRTHHRQGRRRLLRRAGRQGSSASRGEQAVPRHVLNSQGGQRQHRGIGGSGGELLIAYCIFISHIACQLQANVLCESESYRTTRAAVTIISDAFIPSSCKSPGDDYHTIDAPSEDPVKEPESIELSLRAGRVAGRLTGKSDSLKRPVFDRTGTNNSGMYSINIHSFYCMYYSFIFMSRQD